VGGQNAEKAGAIPDPDHAVRLPECR